MNNHPPDLSMRTADAVNRFQLDLRERFPEPENLVFSPLGFYVMLAMLHEGARGTTRTLLSGLLSHHDPGMSVMPGLKSLLGELHSRTKLTAAEETMQKELKEQEKRINELAAEGQGDEENDGCIGPISAPDISLDLSIASGMWVQDTCETRPEFVETIRSAFASEAGVLDFEGDPVHACQAINEWAGRATRGRIQEMISAADLPSFCRMILANAVYFKARWQHEFQAPRTGAFHLLDGSIVEAQMMTGKFRMLHYLQTDSFLAVELPYYQRPVSMVITMPLQYGPAALQELRHHSERFWNDDGLRRPAEGQRVILTIPEFEIQSGHELSCRLSEPETQSIFGQSADFSGISDGQGLRAARILQRAFVNVNQHGTEAAAATLATLFRAASAPIEDITITIDHPFLFEIVDKPTEVVLFAGTVVNPLS